MVIVTMKNIWVSVKPAEQIIEENESPKYEVTNFKDDRLEKLSTRRKGQNLLMMSEKWY